MTEDEKNQIREKIAELRHEHRNLDEMIHRLTEESAFDQLQITRMKKRKLFLKDSISRLESKLIPDLNA